MMCPSFERMISPSKSVWIRSVLLRGSLSVCPEKISEAESGSITETPGMAAVRQRVLPRDRYTGEAGDGWQIPAAAFRNK